MSDMRALQDEIIRDFSLLEDPFDQYTYLLELSSLLPHMSEDRKKSLSPVAGCQSHVYLDSRTEDGRFFVEADSDTMLIRGLLYLLIKVLSDQPAEAVANAKLDFLEQSGVVGSLLEDGRRQGIGYVVRELRRRAALDQGQ